MEPTAIIVGDRSSGRGVPPEMLRHVNELYEAVRAWADVGSRFGPVPLPPGASATAAYLDMMFAYGMARLGEVRRSAALAEAARSILEALPADDPSGIAGRFLARAFQFRIGQAVAGQSPTAQLQPVLLDELNDLDRKSEGRANSTPGMAYFVINRMRELSRILEPFDQIDLYKRFTTPHEGGLKQALYELVDDRDPAKLADRIRWLYRQNGPPASDYRPLPMTEEQFDILRECLPLAARCGGEFAAELIRLVPGALRQHFPGQKELHRRQAGLLECAFSLAEHFGAREMGGSLTDTFTELVAAKIDVEGLEVVCVVCGSCVRCLRALGLREELNTLLQRLSTTALGGGAISDLKARLSNRPEQWMRAISALLNIGGGWLTLGLADQASPILDEARSELLTPPAKKCKPLLLENTRLARAYVAAVGHEPAESGLERMADLFRRIHRHKITN